MSSQETTDTQTFSNEQIQVNVTKKPHCHVKFDISVQPQAVEAAYSKAVKNVSKEVSVPGFRKGKAPEKYIQEKYASTIQKEWIDLVLQTAFNESIHLTQLAPLKNGEFKRPVVHECSKEKGAKFSIEFETQPQVPSVDFSQLQIAKITPTPVTDKDRNSAFYRVALQFTTYEAIEDRPAQAGDFVDLNVDIIEDNQATRQVINNQRTQISDEGLPAWIRQKVIGLKAGETAEGNTEQDPEQTNPDFKSVPFRVTVNAIWKGNMPALDDELAQKVGAQSIDELKSQLEDRLQREAQEEATQKEMEQLDQLLVEKFPFDLPHSMIQKNTETRLNNYFSQIQGENIDTFVDDHYKQIEQTIENSTIRQLQLLYLLRKIAADHQIDVDNNDLSREFYHQISLLPTGRNSINLQGNKEEVQAQLYNLALDRKIKQFLLNKVISVKE